MTQYAAPLRDMLFALQELVPVETLLAKASDGLTLEMAQAVLDEAAKFATGVLSPTDATGDRIGATWSPEGVVVPQAYRDAYARFVAAGWHAMPCATQYGGQGMPRVVSALADEMWHAASLTLMGCTALTRGAIEALSLRASDQLRDVYLPPMIEGRWTGTMNLTEPQAGSDLSGIRTHAVPHADGSWRVSGQKIFISWGEHDMSENIVHLVLARTPDAPPGIKGLSMFLVPKFLPRADGSCGERNRLRCLSIEHKVGQHGGPTTTMLYGDDDPSADAQRHAVGFLVSELHQGLETMFIMMNEARFAVGLEGLAISERAYQTARAYARDRVQGTEAGSRSMARVPIVRHPDVRRMLMRMRASTDAMRAFAIGVAALIDEVHLGGGDPHARGLLDLLTPILKGWGTETAQVITTLGVQIHGGLGFMNECRAAQHWKDARILPIYEGTTGIQASDLVGRKMARDRGEAAHELIRRMTLTAGELQRQPKKDLQTIGAALAAAASAAADCVGFVAQRFHTDPRLVLAGSAPLLNLLGLATAGWQMARLAQAAERSLADGHDPFFEAKIATCRFFAEHEMAAIPGLAQQVLHGGASVLALAEDQF